MTKKEFFEKHGGRYIRQWKDGRWARLGFDGRCYEMTYGFRNTYTQNNTMAEDGFKFAWHTFQKLMTYKTERMRKSRRGEMIMARNFTEKELANMSDKEIILKILNEEKLKCENQNNPYWYSPFYKRLEKIISNVNAKGETL